MAYPLLRAVAPVSATHEAFAVGVLLEGFPVGSIREVLDDGWRRQSPTAELETMVLYYVPIITI